MSIPPIEQNWLRVVDEVRAAESAAGRDEGSVRIVGVTKYVDADLAAILVAAGCTNLGENRPQMMWKKADAISTGIQWHLIGQLQTNKIRRTLKLNPIIHSIDREPLLSAIADEVVKQTRDTEIDLLLEVNISGDQTKTGLSVDRLRELVDSLPRPGVRVQGLMAMAGSGTDPAQARKQFAAVRELRDKVAREAGHPLPELSMGMSGDFREAIAEGATMVRIGSRLFAE